MAAGTPAPRLTAGRTRLYRYYHITACKTYAQRGVAALPTSSLRGQFILVATSFFYFACGSATCAVIIFICLLLLARAHCTRALVPHYFCTDLFLRASLLRLCCTVRACHAHCGAAHCADTSLRTFVHVRTVYSYVYFWTGRGAGRATIDRRGLGRGDNARQDSTRVCAYGLAALSSAARRCR